MKPRTLRRIDHRPIGINSLSKFLDLVADSTCFLKDREFMLCKLEIAGNSTPQLASLRSKPLRDSVIATGIVVNK